MYKSLSIYGYRGFSKEQQISFAVPNEENSRLGLTMIVGGNNSGKSTIIEAMGLFSGNAQLTIQPKRRNLVADCVEIKAEFKDGTEACVSNREQKDSVLEFVPKESRGAANAIGTIIKIPSRRQFPEYSSSIVDIGAGLSNHISFSRGDPLHQIGGILRTIRTQPALRARLNTLLSEVTGIELKWGIEVSDADVNSHYIKFDFINGSHSSEGLGEGLISLFVILLPFVEENRYPIVSIDEPELSLHPALQRRLFNKLIEFSKKQQIIINTHSPYFVDLGLIKQGAKIVRVFKNIRDEVEIGELQEATAQALEGNIAPYPRQPQYFGLDMKEILFAEDGVILTEGQEDVVCFRRGLHEIHMTIPAEFFGWGAGGSGNISKICKLLQDLKYHSVVGIFDNEPAATTLKQTCERNFPNYKFHSLPTADIRDKPDKEIIGMFEENFKLKEESKAEFTALINGISTDITAMKAAPI